MQNCRFRVGCGYHGVSPETCEMVSGHVVQRIAAAEIVRPVVGFRQLREGLEGPVKAQRIDRLDLRLRGFI